MNGLPHGQDGLPGRHRPRRRWALPTLLAALSGLVAGALVLEADDRAETQRSARLAAAERTVVYTVTPTEGPRFRLLGGAETILLVAHLQLPREPYHPGRTYRFAVIATLRAPDGTLLSRWSITRRTRQTKAEPGGDGTWGYESAFVPDGRIQITDGAAIELSLPITPPRSTLELRLTEETGLLGADDRTLIAAFAEPRALVRVYRQIDVADAEAQVQAEGEGKGAGSRRLATYLPWHALDAARRRQSVGTGWERLAAEGHTGVDYEAQGIYVAAARPAPLPPEVLPAIEVAPAQPAVVHVQGPALATVRARLAPAALGRGEALTGAAAVIQARWLGPLRALAGDEGDGDGNGEARDPGIFGQVRSDLSMRTEQRDPADGLAGEGPGEAAPRRLDLPADGAWVEVTVPIPRGWTSLELASAAAGAELQVITDAPGRHVGVDAHDHHRLADGQPFVPVDLRSAPLYVVGPAATPLLVDLGGPGDVYARVLRVDARAVGAPHPLPLRVEFLDREGRVLDRVDETLEPAGPAPFERLRPLQGRPQGPAVRELLAPTVAATTHADGIQGAAPPPGRDEIGADAAAATPGPAAAADEDRAGALLSVWRGVTGELGAAIEAALGRGADDPLGGADAVRPGDEDEEAPEEDPASAGEVGSAALGFPLGISAVSESAPLRLIAPQGAVQARIRGLAPALVAIRGLLPPADEPADGPPWIWPYDQVVHGDERWRFAPLRRARWFAAQAIDHQARVDRGEVMLLHGQVRREAGAARERAHGPWEAIHPEGRHPRLSILERVSAEQRAQAIAGWGAGSFTALRRGASVAFDLGRAGARPPSIWAQVTGSATRAIGEEIAVRSGESELRWPIGGRLERRPLPTSTERRAAVTWLEGPPGVVLLVDRPPRSPAPIYRRRQLHRLGRGGLTLTVDKPTAARMTVNVVIYWIGGAPGGPTDLRVELDGGAPRRRTAAATSHFTAAARTLVAVPSERVALLHEDARGEGRGQLLRAVVVLGDDVAAGRHTIRFTHAGGPPVWLRFFRQSGGPAPARAWQWQERRDGLLVEVDDAPAE